MISYRDNVDGMRQAINAKRAKYAKGQRLNNNKRHGIIDLTDTKTDTADKGLKASISPNSKPSFFTISEDKGIEDYDNMDMDEYEKYDSQFDGQADQFLINSGATIIRSEITLTDSSGRNRVLVRRDDNNE